MRLNIFLQCKEVFPYLEVCLDSFALLKCSQFSVPFTFAGGSFIQVYIKAIFISVSTEGGRVWVEGGSNNQPIVWPIVCGVQRLQWATKG